MDFNSKQGLAHREQRQYTKVDAVGASQHTVSSLGIPMNSYPPRRPSPRVEDMMRSPRKAQRTRQRLSDYHSFDDAVKLLNRSRHVVVLTGAGISTSVGIPDFRSDKGLYNKLSKIGITQPEDFFSMSYFQDNPEDFFKYVREVVPAAVPGPDGTYKDVQNPRNQADGAASAIEVPKFTPTHAFLALLQSKGKLLTNYTQNIDGLERAAGLPNDQYVQCHGSWDTATCLTCGKSSSAKKYLPVVHSGNVPFCKCFNEVSAPTQKPKRKRDKSRTGKKRKRANSFSDHSSDDGTKPLEPPRGLLKPDLVFFEEKITPLYHSRLETDRSKIDLLIIIGTSLKVAPIQYMLFKVRPDVPQIYISKERFSGALCSLPGVQVDIELLGECDIIVEELCRRAGWTASLNERLWKPGQTKIKSASIHVKVDERSHSLSEHEKGLQHPLNNARSKVDVADTAKGSTESVEYDTVESTRPAIHSVFEQEHAGSMITTRQVHPSMTSLSTNAERPTKEEHLSDPVDHLGSKVKVELVEGTDHQWRITRNK